MILGICPAAQLVDLTHGVTPQDVLEGQLALESAWRFFPAGTVHLAVVDPGVGGARRALAMRADGHLFVGPDNGLFTFALAARDWSAVALETNAYRLADVSVTFHGRDVFAPAAAHLAAGLALEQLGPPIHDPVRLPLPRGRIAEDGIVGEVIRSDRFGNLITSVDAEDVRALGGRGEVAIEVGGRRIAGLATSYEAGPPGVAAAIIGSSGRLEVFVRNDSAARVTGAARGTPVRLCVRPPTG